MNLTVIKQTLDINEGEERPLGLLLIYAFFMGVTLASFFAASSGLFLVSFTSGALPYVYITAAIVSGLTGGLFALLKERLSLTGLLYATQVFLLASVLIFWLGLQSARSDWATFSILAWFTVISALNNVALWGLAGQLFDVRQGKRLFGLVGAGEMGASVLSGFATPLFVELWGATHLLLVSACGLVGSILALTAIVRTFGERIESPPNDSATPLRFVNLVRNPYIRIIFALYLISVTVFYFIDYGFLDRARWRYQDEKELAQFFGVFYAVSQGLSLLLMAFLTGRVLNRFGIRVGMRVRPIVLLCGALILVFTGLSAEAGILLFWMTVGTKLSDLVLFQSFNGPALLVLYQPLHDDHKLATQIGVETLIRPLAGAVAGLALIGLTFLDSYRLLALNSATSILIFCWLFVGVVVYRAYRSALSGALARRRLEGTDISINQDGVSDVLRRYLDSPHAGETIYALDLMEKNDNQDVENDLAEMIRHPSPEVRRNVLERIGLRKSTNLLPDVRRQVEVEADLDVMSTALVTWCELGEADVVDEVALFLDHEAPEVRRGAMVGLLRSGGIDGVLLAGRFLMELEETADPSQRTFVARVLGEVEISSFYRPLLRLLRDDDTSVRKAAIAAAGKIRSDRLWPLVIENLMEFQFHSSAASAFATAGSHAIPALARAYEQPSSTVELRVSIAAVLGRIQGSETVQFLKQHLDLADGRDRLQIFRSLHLCGYRATGQEFKSVDQCIRKEVKAMVELLACLADCGTDPKLDLLRRACNDEIELGRRRFFFLLSFLHDSTTILRSQENLKHESPQQRAYALEVLHTTLSHEHEELVLPLCESTTVFNQLERLRSIYPQKAMSRGQRLQLVAQQTIPWIHPWIRANAIRYLSEEGQLEPEILTKLAFDDDDLVRETAVSTLFQIEPEIYARYASSLKQEPNQRISQTARNLEQWEEGGRTMLLTIEKVMVLKSVRIFAGIPEEVLANLAPHLDEVDLPAGEDLYEKGGMGDTMYIIVEGEVRVHDGDHTVVILGEREFFGELTTLDPQPHAATVTAEKDALLLGLERETLYELMSDHPEVLRGIVQVLCQRLRRK